MEKSKEKETNEFRMFAIVTIGVIWKEIADAKLET